MAERHEALICKFESKRDEVAGHVKKIRKSVAELNEAIRVVSLQVEAEIGELTLSLEEHEELRDRIADVLQDDFRELDDDKKQTDDGRRRRRWVKAWRDADANPSLSVEDPEQMKVDGLDTVDDLMELQLTPA